MCNTLPDVSIATDMEERELVAYWLHDLLLSVDIVVSSPENLSRSDT